MKQTHTVTSHGHARAAIAAILQVDLLKGFEQRMLDALRGFGKSLFCRADAAPMQHFCSPRWLGVEVLHVGNEVLD